jgi:phage tail tube protein FII
MTNETLVAVVLRTKNPAAGQAIGVDVDELTLEQLMTTEPLADAMTTAVRLAIGAKLRETRAALGLSLEEVRDRYGIDSGSLSRIERGQRWSPDTAAEAVKVYARERGKQERAGERKSTKAKA